MKFVKALVAFAIVAAVVGVFLIMADAPHSDANVSFKVPVNISGSWHQNDNDNTPVTMTAEITGDHIEIMMESDAVSGLYWGGTIDTKNVFNPSQITSVSDESALSQDKTKVFHYKNGDLSYDFTMLGKTYTVHLSRGE